MSDENKNESCNFQELAEKLVASLKDNERLEKIMRDLKKENETLKSLVSLQNRFSCSTGTGSQSSTTGHDQEYKEKFEALVEINHCWKKDYNELRKRFEMLKGEWKLLEDEGKKLKLRINELETRQGPMESELARRTARSFAQQGNNVGGHLETQCELFKSQIIVYKKDFERERNDRENLNKEKEKYQHQLEDAEETIRKLTTELDDYKGRQEVCSRDWSEDGYLGERAAFFPRGGYHTVLVTTHNNGIQGYRSEPPVLVIPNSNYVLPLETGNPSQNDERDDLQQVMDYITQAL